MIEIKNKKCKACTGEFKPFRTTDNACSSECYRALETVKKRKKESRAEKRADTKRKSLFKVNDVRHQHDLTQVVFNKMRRLQEIEWFTSRGRQPECISCGKKNMDWCCGHMKTVGAQGSLRYSEENTKLQCNKYCNMSLSGNLAGTKTSRGYLKGLFERFGVEEAQRIIEFCEKDTVKKWTGEKLREMRVEFNKKIRLLENN